jgi:hypothetical protein
MLTCFSFSYFVSIGIFPSESKVLVGSFSHIYSSSSSVLHDLAGVCSGELMSCSSTLSWICSSVANTHPLVEYAQHHGDAGKLAAVCSFQVAVACLVRSGQHKVSWPVLCC